MYVILYTLCYNVETYYPVFTINIRTMRQEHLYDVFVVLVSCMMKGCTIALYTT
jgi:hypothetical protein